MYFLRAFALMVHVCLGNAKKAKTQCLDYQPENQQKAGITLQIKQQHLHYNTNTHTEETNCSHTQLVQQDFAGHTQAE